MLSRLSLKSKILCFVVPALAYMIGLSGVLVHQSYRVRTQADQLELSANYYIALSRLVHVLQKERGLSGGFLIGKVSRPELEAHRNLVNSKIDYLKQVISSLPELERERTSARLSEYLDLRKAVDAHIQPAESTAKFSALIENLIWLQSDRARAYPMQGIENKLISQSIFEMAKENSGRLRVFVSGVLGQDKPINVADLSKINTYKLGVTMNLESPGLVISDRARKDVQSLLAAADWNQVLRTIEKIQSNASIGGYGQDSKTFFDTITRVIDGIGKAIDQETDGIMSVIHSTQSAATTSFWLYLLTASLGGAGITLIAWQVTREVTSKLVAVETDLSQSVSVVGESAENLSAASQQLSSGATEGAASLQETVASLEELSSMVKQNAAHSTEAADLSKMSAHSATEGETEINRLIEAMSGISESSRKIEEIINIIDDIAFQTNLLALNAAVEAARAGEHGKGFAVVAEAVRALAQRSSAAAKDISHLIKDSVTKTEHGSKIAGQCGEVLKNIVDSVKKVMDLNGEIAEASRQQASGIAQISGAMNQLDSVTQINAASAEEAAASSGQLSDQTRLLKDMVIRLSVIVEGAARLNQALPGAIQSSHEEIRRDTKPNSSKVVSIKSGMKHPARGMGEKEPRKNETHTAAGA